MLKKIGNIFNDETYELEEEMNEVDDIKEEEDENYENEKSIDSTFKVEKEIKSVKDRRLVRIYEPVSKSVVTSIIDALKRGELVIVNISKLSDDEAKNIYNTLAGSIYSLDGEMKMIDPTVVLCAPRQYILDGDDTNL